MHSENVYRQETSEIIQLGYMNAKDIDILIGKNLKRLRQKAGLTQDQLGEKIGVDGNVIAQIEGAVRGMGKSMMTRLCNTLKIETWEFHWTEKTPIIKDEREQLDLFIRREAEKMGIGNQVREAEAIWLEAAKKRGQATEDLNEKLRNSLAELKHRHGKKRKETA